MTDYEQVESRLEDIGYSDNDETRQQIRETVLELLYVLDNRLALAGTDREAAAELFQSIVAGDNLLGDARGVWKPFKLGDVKRGSIVRVQSDAYDSATGRMHNGLVGRFAEARAGRCIVSYIGRKDGQTQLHSPQKLEVLVK